MNAAAQELGRMAAGVPKNFSKAEISRRSKRMKALNKQRALDGTVAGNSHQRRKAKRKAIKP